MPVLIGKTTDGKTLETPVEDLVVIGRGTGCDLQVPDERASRRHCRVYRQGRDYFLRDLGSKNGTRLNGRPVTFARLVFGDEIGVGRTALLFAERSPAELVGSEIAGYEVLAQIASGGMGVVYKARQLSMDRIVALKVLHPRLTADQRFIERFVREAHAAGALNHVNIVHVQDAGEADGTFYYVMEFVDGPTVAQELRARGPIPAERAVDVVRQVASALAFAHRQGILHRDVKPENIMLASDGTAKLADLGLAMFVETDHPQLERGADGKLRVWGTPSYMAPEVAQGKEPDARSDLYSLGATLFHILTARVPFTGATATEVLSKHVSAPLPEMQDYRPDVPRVLNPIVERLMAKRRERRYQAADALVADLNVVLATLRQSTSDEETRFVTPLTAARPVGGASALHRLADWLRRRKG